MITSIFQGDLALTVSVEGLTLTFRGGQPVLDRGLTNAVLQSLFFDPWFVNSIMDDSLYHIGSEFLQALQKPITVSNLSVARTIGLKALQWLIDEKAAAEIDVRIQNREGQTLQVLVMIKPPALPPIVLFATGYGLNWTYQIGEVS